MSRSTLSELARDLADGVTTIARSAFLHGNDLARALGQLPEGSPIRAAHAYWSTLASGGRLPARRDVDPVAIGAASLPYIVLIDIEPGAPRRIRYRLVGTSVVRLIHGADYTGRYIDELGMDTAMDNAVRFYTLVADERCPGLYQGHYINRSGLTFNVVRLAAPLSSDGRTVDSLFCAMERPRPG